MRGLSSASFNHTNKLILHNYFYHTLNNFIKNNTLITSYVENYIILDDNAHYLGEYDVAKLITILLIKIAEKYSST